MTGPSFRAAVKEHARALVDMDDLDLRALAVASVYELARRDGVTETATWAADQATRLRCLDAVTVDPA